MSTTYVLSVNILNFDMWTFLNVPFINGVCLGLQPYSSEGCYGNLGCNSKTEIVLSPAQINQPLVEMTDLSQRAITFKGIKPV